MNILRYAILGLFSLGGFFYHWLKTEWRPPIFWLAVTALSVWLAERIAVYLHLFNLKEGMWFQFWNILAVYTVLALLWLAWQARKRVVIEEFADYSNNQPKAVAGGLATLLVIKLAQLRELYHSINEARPIPTNIGIDSSIEATINVEDIGSTLKDAVSAESRFNLGPIGIPVGTLMALIARLVQGPRIIGSLHKDKDLWILTARRVGGDQSYSWRVDRSISSSRVGGQEINGFDEMVTELVLRVFSDLALKGSVRWRAISTFIEALHAYRDGLRTPKDEKLNLKQAAKKLIETVAEDEKFDLAYYNLGVVYSEMGQAAAAEIAFSKAMSEAPNLWEAYYALAVHHFHHEQYESVVRLCEHVVSLKPGKVNAAKAYHLKGLAQRRFSEQRYLKEQQRLKNLGTIIEQKNLDELRNNAERRRFQDMRAAIKSRKKSVTRSWMALCTTKLKIGVVIEAKRGIIPQVTALASLCLADLAIAYGYHAKMYSDQAGRSIHIRRWLALIKWWHAFHKAKALFWQVLFLNPSNADYHFELGKAYYEWKKFNQAIQEFKVASRINPERNEFWAYLALASAIKKDEETVQYACGKILACASEASEENLKMAAEAYANIDQAGKSQSVAGINEFLRELKAARKEDLSIVPDLKKKLEKYGYEGKEWEYAQVAYSLGQVYLKNNKPNEAELSFREAIEKFDGRYSQEIRVQKLRKLLIDSLLKQERYDEALKEAEQALLLEPLSASIRESLGQVYFDLNQFDRAIVIWEEALLRKPDVPEIYFNLGLSYLLLAQQYRGFTRRNAAFQQSIEHLRRALDLYENEQKPQKGATLYFLGILHIEWGQYEEAITCLKTAQTLEFARLSSTFHLGLAYLKNKDYDESIEQLKSLLAEKDLIALDGDTKDIVDDYKSGERMRLGVLFVLTYCALASVYAECDGTPNLLEALKHIEAAEKHIRRLNKINTEAVHSRLNYLAIKGWIYYKQGEFPIAINCLEKALTLTVAAETYWRLALAFENKLRLREDQTQLNFLIMRARFYCNHVQELDTQEEYKQSIEDLLQRLKEYEQPIKQQEEQQVNSQAQKQSESAATGKISAKEPM